MPCRAGPSRAGPCPAAARRGTETRSPSPAPHSAGASRARRCARPASSAPPSLGGGAGGWPAPLPIIGGSAAEACGKGSPSPLRAAQSRAAPQLPVPARPAAEPGRDPPPAEGAAPAGRQREGRSPRRGDELGQGVAGRPPRPQASGLPRCKWARVLGQPRGGRRGRGGGGREEGRGGAPVLRPGPAAGRREGRGLLGRPLPGAEGRRRGAAAGVGVMGEAVAGGEGPPGPPRRSGRAQSACSPAGIQQLGDGGPRQRGAEAEVPTADGRWEGEAAPLLPRAHGDPSGRSHPPAATRGFLLAAQRSLPGRRLAAGRWAL